MLTFYLSLADSEENRQKIESVYNEYKNFMMGISMQILKNQDLASESVHDSVIKLIGNIHRIDEVLSDRTKAFVYIVTANTAKTKLRKENRFQDIVFNIAQNVSVSKNDVFEQVFLNELMDAVLKLPAIYRDPLELSVYYGMSSKEIANLLGISDSLARKRISRAKESLKSIFEKEGI